MVRKIGLNVIINQEPFIGFSGLIEEEGKIKEIKSYAFGSTQDYEFSKSLTDFQTIPLKVREYIEKNYSDYQDQYKIKIEIY